MYQQSQIRRNLACSEGIVRLQALMNAENFENRSAIGRRVCEDFGFYDARGQVQLIGCMKVLRELNDDGQICLSASTRAKRQVKARGLGHAVAAAEEVPERLDQVSGLELELVRIRMRTGAGMSMAVSTTRPASPGAGSNSGMATHCMSLGIPVVKFHWRSKSPRLQHPNRSSLKQC